MDENPAEQAIYSPAEAAKYAQISPASVARWRVGYTYPTQQGRRRSEPLTGGSRERLLTFSELIEIAVVAAARHANVPMVAVRRAIEVARNLYGVERPLLLLRFQHDGRQIFVDELVAEGPSRIVNLSRQGQVAWDLIRDVLEDLDYEDGIAGRWWPSGRETPIVIDPKISFGRPYVISKGVSTDVVRSRFLANESLESIAEDLDLTRDEAEAAVRFELPAAA